VAAVEVPERVHVDADTIELHDLLGSLPKSEVHPVVEAGATQQVLLCLSGTDDLPRPSWALVSNDEVIKVRGVLAFEAVDQLRQRGSLHAELLAESGVGDLPLAREVGERAKGGEDGIQLLFRAEAPLDVEQLDHVIELLKIISASSSIPVTGAERECRQNTHLTKSEPRLSSYFPKEQVTRMLEHPATLTPVTRNSEVALETIYLLYSDRINQIIIFKLIQWPKELEQGLFVLRAEKARDFFIS
jgi:hypothetical protein